jgi:hypothetical protein
MRPVPEKFSVACRRLSVLIDGQYDRLDVVIAPSLVHTDLSNLGQSFEERRMISAVGEISLHHFQPRGTLPAVGPGAASSLSRSVQSVSIFASILCSRISAEAAEIPARRSLKMSFR